MKRRLFVYWPYALLLGFVLVFFWDSILGGKALVMRDTVMDCLPWRLFGRQAFRADTIPLWNPYSSCGAPFIANPQTAFFYPPHLLFYVLPAVAALKLWQVFHFGVAAISMYGLARHWKLGHAAALIAAVGFAFGTNMISAVEFQSMIGTIAWNPLALLLTGRLVEEGAHLRALGLKNTAARMIPATLGLALTLATQFLAGHEQSLIHSLAIDLIYLALIGLHRRDLKAFLASGSAWGAAALLALGLGMTQFLLTWQLVPLSVRAAEFDPQMKMASLHPRLLLTWLIPFLVGHPGHQDQWWGTRLTMDEFWFGTAYIGIGPLMLASIGLLGAARLGTCRIGRRPSVLATFLIILVAIGLVMSMGIYTPVYSWCYAHLPLLDKFRWPAKFLQLVAFAMPLLAGLGLHHLCRAAGRTERRLQLALLLAWAALWAAMAIAWIGWRHSRGFFSALTDGAILPYATPRNLAALADDLGWAVLFLGLSLAAAIPLAFEIKLWLRRAAASLIVLLAFANLFVIGRQIQPILSEDVYRNGSARLAKINDESDPGRIHVNNPDHQYWLYGVKDPNFFALAKDSCAGESSLPDHLFKIDGGDALALSYYDYFRKNLWTLPETDPNWSRFAALTNVRRIVKTAPMQEMLAGSAPATIDIKTTTASLPRAMVVSSWAVELDSAMTIRRLLAADFDPYRSIIVDAIPDGWPAGQPIPATGARAPITRLADAGIDKIHYGWNRVDITARSSGRAMLFLDDVFYPDWRATVDGDEVPILRANAIFRAVPLGAAGVHHVSFTYWPPLVTLGLTITAVTALIMVMMCAFSRRVRRADKPTAPRSSSN